MSLFILVIILVACLIAEGFFSGSEMALVNADKYRLALATDGGSKAALAALHMVKRPAKFFATTLIGTNICTITGSVATTLFIISRFGEEYAVLAVIYWPFTLVLGEIIPKSVCQHYADRLVFKLAPILLAVSFILHPFVWLFSKLTDSLLGDVRKTNGMVPPLSREELELILEVGHTGFSDVKPAERTMISRIFDLADKRVKNIMTPLVDVAALSILAQLSEAESLLEKHGFSRVPVFDGRIFNVVGVLEGADLLFGGEEAKVSDLVKPAYYISEEMPLDELLVAMRRKGESLAVAVDEYGAATGIVTSEDVLEEVVGEIHDEHDVQPAHYLRLGWHRYLVSGRMEIVEANERLRLEIPGGEYKTIAGFVIARLEKIPKAGTSFRQGRFTYVIYKSTERAVLEVEVSENADSVL